MQSKWQHQAQILEGRSLALKESGRALTVETQQCPHLVALSVDDPLATGVVLYYLNEGTTLLGLIRQTLAPLMRDSVSLPLLPQLPPPPPP